MINKCKMIKWNDKMDNDNVVLSDKTWQLFDSPEYVSRKISFVSFTFW